jgi:hypothetical protein
MVEQREQEFLNVKEAWPLYDTILISGWTKGKSVSGWYQNYQQFASKQVHPFFNVRNTGETALAYTNMETKDQMPFAYHIYSLGIDFSAATGNPAPYQEGQVNPVANGNSDAIFIKDIPQHCGLRLKVREDQKLLTTCYMAPSGIGPYGLSLGMSDASAASALPTSITNATQGVPFIDNRWRFPKPIAVPRGATFHVELELSEYARDMMLSLCGPSQYTFNCNGDEDVSMFAASTIRVSLIGKREVQQRGQLHFG